MRLDGKPIRTTLPDPSIGDESRVAAVVVLMDDDGDVGRTTGWCRPAPGQDISAPELWRAAVAEGHGPQTSAEAAFRAAQTATVESMDLAYRLEEGASLIRAGHLDPDAEKLIEYLDRATRIDAKRRGEPDAVGRTAQGLFVEDGLRATSERVAEARKNAPGDIKDIFADCATDEVAPRDEATEAAEDAEIERSIAERLAANAEVGDTTLQDLLEDAIAEEAEAADTAKPVGAVRAKA